MSRTEALDVYMRRLFDMHQAAIQRNRDQWDALDAAEAKRPWWLFASSRAPLPPALPPPLPLSVELRAIQLGWYD